MQDENTGQLKLMVNSFKVNNFLEAPVSGSKPQANSGTLVILAAGKKATFGLAEPFLRGDYKYSILYCIINFSIYALALFPSKNPLFQL